MALFHNLHSLENQSPVLTRGPRLSLLSETELNRALDRGSAREQTTLCRVVTYKDFCLPETSMELAIHDGCPRTSTVTLNKNIPPLTLHGLEGLCYLSGPRSSECATEEGSQPFHGQ